MTKHPIQKMYIDDNGTVRFRENAIVKFLLDTSQFDLNFLALLPVSREDREQFAQLTGYSIGGFNELSYVSEETYDQVISLYNNQIEKSRIADDLDT